MILDINAIRKGLDDRLLPLEPMIMGMRLVELHERDALTSQVSVESSLGVPLPPDLAELTSRFDFGQLTIGPVTFGTSGDYVTELIERNEEAGDPLLRWWEGGVRPDGILLIANSDLFAIFLNTATEEVSVLQHGDPFTGHALVVANGFEPFVRGVGTVVLKRSADGGNEALADAVGDALGGGPGNLFWHHLAE